MKKTRLSNRQSLLYLCKNPKRRLRYSFPLPLASVDLPIECGFTIVVASYCRRSAGTSVKCSPGRPQLAVWTEPTCVRVERSSEDDDAEYIAKDEADGIQLLVFLAIKSRSGTGDKKFPQIKQ